MHNKNSDNQLPKILRKLRLGAGFTQQNLADALNINRSTYTYYETGKTSPDIHTLKVLSRIFDVPIDMFLEEEMSRNLADGAGRRPKKTVHDNPKKIAELSSLEKSLIAVLRANDGQSLQDVIDDLQKKQKSQENQ